MFDIIAAPVIVFGLFCSFFLLLDSYKAWKEAHTLREEFREKLYKLINLEKTQASAQGQETAAQAEEV